QWIPSRQTKGESMHEVQLRSVLGRELKPYWIAWDLPRCFGGRTQTLVHLSAPIPCKSLCNMNPVKPLIPPNSSRVCHMCFCSVALPITSKECFVIRQQGRELASSSKQS